VVVAAQEIPERTQIQPPMLLVKDWPVEVVPPGVISNTQEAIGKFAVEKIYPGEPIFRAKLGGPKEAKTLSYAIPAGMVAVAVPATAISSVAGAIQPGDYVDVLLSIGVSVSDALGNKSEEQYTTQLTLQDVEVLRVGPWTAAPKAGQPQAAAESYANITLLLNRQDALVMKYIREKGAVDFALRPVNDHETFTTDAVILTYVVERFKLPKPPIIIKK
jgi:pilus assembly protein CpaB